MAPTGAAARVERRAVAPRRLCAELDGQVASSPRQEICASPDVTAGKEVETPATLEQQTDLQDTPAGQPIRVLQSVKDVSTIATAPGSPGTCFFGSSAAKVAAGSAMGARTMVGLDLNH